MSRREAIGRIVGLAATVVAAQAGLSACLDTARRDATARGTDSRSDIMTIGCTACGACRPCRYDVDIAACFAVYNAAVADGRLPDPRRQAPSVYRRARRTFLSHYNRLDQFARADRCIGCRECESRCPERLDVVAQLRRVEALAEQLTHDEYVGK